jgi:TolB-like protein
LPAGAPAEDDPAKTTVELKKGDSIIFFGDSLTALAGQDTSKKHFTTGYVQIVREKLQETHKELDVKVDWVATGGHTVPDLLKRVDKDVIAKKPTIVVIQIGVNDAGGGVTPEMFKAQLEELIDKLSKIPDLRVPPPTSSFYFKGRLWPRSHGTPQVTIADVAKTLGVTYVLDGSVRKSGGRLRVDARLIRADNGYVVWSETYDRPLDDILIVQDDIAGEVTKALRASIDGVR